MRTPPAIRLVTELRVFTTLCRYGTIAYAEQPVPKK